MSQLPFEIPKSLSSYAEHFEDEPDKAIERLKKQLQKRGPDAVGHFLLAWFYHLEGRNEQAIEEALKARIFAPGSPFFQKLHYYLSHPQTLEAWTPDTTTTTSQKSSKAISEPGPILNLDSLIQKLSAVESHRIRPKLGEQEQEPEQKPISDDVDDIVSETLADIHEKQGKTEAAIRTYKRLKKLNKEKEEHYSAQIKRLKELNKEDGK